MSEIKDKTKVVPVSQTQEKLPSKGQTLAGDKPKRCQNNWSKKRLVLVTALCVTSLGGLIVLILFMMGFFESLPDTQQIDTEDNCHYPANFPTKFHLYEYVFELSPSSPILKATLPKSKTKEIVLLKRIPTIPTDFTTTLARSYDTYEWENTLPSEAIDINCTHIECETDIFSSCIVEINASLDDGRNIFNYQLSNIDASYTLNELGWSKENDAAHLLIQATFGPTRKSIADVPARAEQSDEIDVNKWLNQQFSLPLTSMRERWRQRSSPRITGAYSTGEVAQSFGVRNLVEAVTTPCDVGSRWHKYTFTYKDLRKKLTVSAIEKPRVLTLRVDGILRTELTHFAGITWSESLAQNNATQITEYYICSVKELVGEEVRVRIVKNPNTDVGCKGYSFRHWNQKEWKAVNPALNFSEIDKSVTFEYSEPNEIRLAEVLTMMGDAVVIEYMSPARQLSCDPNLKIGVYHSLLYLLLALSHSDFF